MVTVKRTGPSEDTGQLLYTPVLKIIQSKATIISIIFILAGAIALIIGFGISGGPGLAVRPQLSGACRGLGCREPAALCRNRLPPRLTRHIQTREGTTEEDSVNVTALLGNLVAAASAGGAAGRHSITVSTLTSAGNIGEDGILSCTFEPDIKLSDIVIQWLKEGALGLVHEFKEGKDDLSEQDAMFRGRTAVFADQVVVGNASLRLKNVQLTDAGTYKCHIITSRGKGNANLEYKTGAFSMPEVNVDYNASSESLRCEAPRWFPQPTVVWASQVDQGANFSEVSNTSFELNSENVTMKVVSVLYNVTINNTYSCMIENDIAKATGDIKVTGGFLPTP
ncbi:V-set domain-containing T-cell activation inhibitor 1 [Galemys pyrenaicus]|uniref:V-set domain-containing T-cell activation inhibitor 1 n=1 Tax=Galemys pyrenaicus TaxID=202257 RepID=A0A8J6AFZ8_GALPY|nr:V-set domain-containing T-cell activation inhibitor 1 [Galemys pyrenaicus]